MLISDLGEEGLIEELRRLFSVENDDIRLGIGDDAAVIAASDTGLQVWTTDILVEGVHFVPEWQEPEMIGRKGLLANISDLAAMGARPEFALLSLGLPRDSETDFVLGICKGIAREATASGIKIVGGDTTDSPAGIVINIALFGSVQQVFVTRSGARPGDLVAVTGELGGPAAGLKLLQSEDDSVYHGLIEAFLIPPFRVEAGAAAAGAGISAMTDISDGLATDIRHICTASGVGARLESARFPTSEEFDSACGEFGWDPLRMALSGGEEFELLMTIPEQGHRQTLEDIAAAGNTRVTIIGVVTEPETGIIIVDADGSSRELDVSGYQHFRHE